jgi:hypothetical protein
MHKKFIKVVDLERTVHYINTNRMLTISKNKLGEYWLLLNEGTIIKLEETEYINLLVFVEKL